MADRALVDRCLRALVDAKVINGGYVENFRRHVEVVLDVVEQERSVNATHP